MSEAKDDIAELVNNLRDMTPPRSPPFPEIPHIYEVAADIIEEQAARISELEQKLRTTSMEALAISDTNNELAAKVVEMEKDRDDAWASREWHRVSLECQTENLIVSQARLSEAVKVLEPFARAADVINIGYRVTEADLCAAKAFIATLGENKN